MKSMKEEGLFVVMHLGELKDYPGSEVALVRDSDGTIRAEVWLNRPASEDYVICLKPGVTGVEAKGFRP